MLIDEPLSAYRMHASSMCHQAEAAGTHNNDGDSQDRYRYLRWLRGTLKTDLRARIERELLPYERPALFKAYRALRGG